MTTLGGAVLQRGKAGISRHCEASEDADQLFARVSGQLKKLVPFDGSTWFGTDPATLLATRPVRVENIEGGHAGAADNGERPAADAQAGQGRVGRHVRSLRRS